MLMPVYQTRKEKETYHSDIIFLVILRVLFVEVKENPVAVIVGEAGTLEITDPLEMEYPVDICNI